MTTQEGSAHVTQTRPIPSLGFEIPASEFWRDTLQTLELQQLVLDGSRNVILIKSLHVRYNNSLPFQLFVTITRDGST